MMKNWTAEQQVLYEIYDDRVVWPNKNVAVCYIIGIANLGFAGKSPPPVLCPVQ